MYLKRKGEGKGREEEKVGECEKRDLFCLLAYSSNGCKKGLGEAEARVFHVDGRGPRF